MGGTNLVYMLDEEQLNDIAKKAAIAAVDKYKKEEKGKIRHKMIRNTRLLLKSYNDIKLSVEKSVADVNGIDQSQLNFNIDNMDKKEMFIQSIRMSRIRSLIFIAHIERCMMLLKNESESRGIKDRYEIFEDFYVKKIYDYEELGKKHNCSSSTARRCINEMDGMISLYLFGADALSIA